MTNEKKMVAHGIVGGTLVDPDCCVECGDEYAAADLQHGTCQACDNERRGLCPCGSYPGPNRRQCRSCSAEDEADALFHADR